MEVLFGILFFAWMGLSLVWLSTFAQLGRTPWAKRGFRYRRVRWTTAIAATVSFILACVVSQGLPTSTEAARNPIAASTPADSPEISPAAKPSELSNSELEYVSAVQGEAGQLSQSMGRFHDLAQRPEIFDDDWKLNLAKELAMWQIMYTEAQKLQPSARFASVQSCWVGALRDLSNAANEIASGLDHSDVEEINIANGAIVRSNGTVEACAQQMTALSASFAAK
jgi:hypothetical protein